MGLTSEDFTKLPQFDWDKAKTFYYVAKLGSITEASKFLKLSQPSLSRNISILEDELNCKLLTRHSGGVKLTRKGEDLFKHIDDFFRIMKGFTYNQAVMSEDGKKRKIRISATHPVAAYVLNEHLMAYRRIFPNILFEVITNDQMIDLSIMDVDIAIRPFIPDAKCIQQEHFYTFEKKLYTSLSYIEKYGQPQTVEEMRKHHIVAQSEPEKHPYSDTQWILRLGMGPGEIHEPVFKSNSLECLVDAVKEGIGIISCYEEMSIIKSANLKRILPSIKGPLIEDFISYPDYLKEDEQFINFKNFLIRALER